MVNSFLSIKRNRSKGGWGCIFHKINPFKKSKADNLFSNDTLFEHNRYKQQKQNNQHGILLNKPSRHARHGSTQSAIVFGTKKPKHIRHYSHVSCISASNITVNSEDLSAKEFAEIAGIQILSEQDQEEDQEKKCAFCCTSDMSSLIVTNQCTVDSTISSNCLEDINIWDLEFWKHPKQPIIPILHELKTQDTFIKKGRFEITIGIDHHHSHSVPNISTKPVIEWKRKPLKN